MKQGKESIVDLAKAIEERARSAKDYIADTRNVELVVHDATPKAGPILHVGEHRFDISRYAHRQIGERVGIPAKYYDRMLAESPRLLAQNVNHWFFEEPKRQLVRTLHNATPQVRAFLSDGYRPLDDMDVMQVVLPVLNEAQGGIRIASMEVTEKKLYLKALFPSVQGEVKVGDVVQAGFILSNSEIGMGALSVQPFANRLVCTNGMVIPDSRFRKNHVGKRLEVLEGSFEVLSDEARAAQDRATLLKMRDVLRSLADPTQFERYLARMRAAADPSTQVEDPVKAVELLTKDVGLTQKESTGVLTALLRDADYSKWGVANAVTYVANTVEDYDRATELETLGGQIVDLPTSQWKRVQAAA